LHAGPERDILSVEEDSFRPGVFFGGRYLPQSAAVPRFILQGAG
jgi:hypothetical protein